MLVTLVELILWLKICQDARGQTILMWDDTLLIPNETINFYFQRWLYAIDSTLMDFSLLIRETFSNTRSIEN